MSLQCYWLQSENASNCHPSIIGRPVDQGHDQGTDGRSVDQGLTVQVLLEYLQVWDWQVLLEYLQVWDRMRDIALVEGRVDKICCKWTTTDKIFSTSSAYMSLVG